MHEDIELASILEDAKREDFEPNLFSNRDDAGTDFESRMRS